MRIAYQAERYGAVTALAGISLYADHGAVVGLIGPNGAGKTTTMRAILGLIAADEGSPLSGATSSNSMHFVNR